MYDYTLAMFHDLSRLYVKESIARQADQYRHKAEEIRATANVTRDLVCRDALYRLADGYDRLAENLDRVASRSESGAPSKAAGS
jgi:hypothetical protein